MLQTDQSAVKARNTLLTMFVVLCILDTILVIMAQDKWAIGRILATIITMYFVLQGRKWAKWLLMSICSLVVVALTAMIYALGSKLSIYLNVGSVIMAVISVIIPIYMATSQDLNRYFAHQRRKRHNYPQ